MKLFEVTKLGPDTIIRNSIGRVLSAKSISSVLNSVFGQQFSLEDVAPYVRSFNEAMQDVDPSNPNAVKVAQHLWSRLASELSHPKKRNSH